MSAYDAFNPFNGWDDSPPVRVDEVLRGWTHMLDSERPWSEMPRDDQHGMMRPLLSELLNEARDVDHDQRQRRLVTAAHDHGAFRSAQRCSESQLVAELTSIREALRSALRKAGLGPLTVQETLYALDLEIRLAERAAVRGWYRGTIRRNTTGVNWFEKLLEELE
jgi:hypothetical protein